MTGYSIGDFVCDEASASQRGADPPSAADSSAGAEERELRTPHAASRKSRTVFISYSHRDNEIAGTLARQLSSRGVEVSLYSDLPAGADFSKVLVDAIRQSNFVIAVVSPDYLASDWAQGELAIALSSDKLVLPIIVRPTLIDGPLRYIQSLDATADPQYATDQVIQLITDAS